PLAAAQRRGRAREEDRPLAVRQHEARGLAPGEEAAIASHLPHLAEHPLGGLEDREVDVGAGVEDANLERRMRVGLVQAFDDVLSLARVERARLAAPAGGLNVGLEVSELVGATAAREDSVALAGEFSGDGGANKVTGADDRGGGVARSHGEPPGL